MHIDSPQPKYSKKRSRNDFLYDNPDCDYQNTNLALRRFRISENLPSSPITGNLDHLTAENHST